MVVVEAAELIEACSTWLSSQSALSILSCTAAISLSINCCARIKLPMSALSLIAGKCLDNSFLSSRLPASASMSFLPPTSLSRNFSSTSVKTTSS